MWGNLAYNEKGSGKEVILLHGFCESKQIWSRLMSQLSIHFRVLSPDLPGFGQNPALHQDISIDDMAEQVFSWMDQLKIENASLVGHSLGGYVSLAMAEQFPDRVSSLCLFHSSAKADSPDKKEKRDKIIAFIEANGIETFVNNFIPSLFAASSRNKINDTIQEVVNLAAQTFDATAISVTRAMRNRPERLHVLKNAAFPCLFIAGREDEAVPYNDMKQQSHLPDDALLTTLEDCGHMGMYEKPDEALQALMAFFESTK